ncbi:hypothetical protein HK405_009501 [Cladochytrium tenue]|nr:hypothetical protein HK405_009501 [Cladochytrium tenue]
MQIDAGSNADVVVVSALELKRLTLESCGAGPEHVLRQSIREDHELLRQKSRARVQNWSNTVAGQRRARLAAREQRQAEEERRREEVDRQHAAEEARRRQAAVDRARELQRNNRDDVRAFHSKVLLYEVLKERDLQVQLKRARSAAAAAAECSSPVMGGWPPRPATAGLPQTSTFNTEDDEAATERQRRAVAAMTAHTQQQQAQAQRCAEVARRAAEIADAQEATAAEEAAAAAAREAGRRRQQQRAVEMRAELGRAREEARRRECAEREAEEAARVGAEDWVERKRRQAAWRKEAEKERIREVIRERERAGVAAAEAAAKHARRSGAVLEAQIERAVAARDAQVKAEEERREERRRAQQEELKKAYEESKKQEEQRRVSQKAAERAELEHHRKEHAEAMRERAAQRERARKEGLELQRIHLSQMNNVHRARTADTASRRSADHVEAAAHEREADELRAYMQGVAGEAWAADDTRLQEYVRRAASAPAVQVGGTKAWPAHRTLRRIVPPPVPHPDVGGGKQRPTSTRERLGFSTGSYAPLDVMRANPIVTGPFPHLLGKIGSTATVSATSTD